MSTAASQTTPPDLLEKAERKAYRNWTRAKATRLRAEADALERPTETHLLALELAKKDERHARREFNKAAERRNGGR